MIFIDAKWFTRDCFTTLVTHEPEGEFRGTLPQMKCIEKTTETTIDLLGVLAKKFYNKNLDAVTAEVEDYALTMKSLVEEFQATVVPMAQKCQASVVRMSNKDKEQCVEENEYEVVVLPDPSGRQEEKD